VRYSGDSDGTGSSISGPSLPWPEFLVRAFGIDFFRDVRALRISYCRIRDYDLEVLEPQFRSLTRLTSLHLGESTGPEDSVDVSDDGLRCLQSLTQLTELTLEGPQFTDRGLPYLQRMTGLHKITLIGTAVTDRGIAELRSRMPTCQIHGEDGKNRPWAQLRLRFHSGPLSLPIQGPPPQDLHGQIVRLRGDCVELSVGADDGVRRGRMFLVERAGQSLAVVRVVSVTPNSASAEVVQGEMAALLRGDSGWYVSKPQ
jgi:hypothetical protein